MASPSVPVGGVTEGPPPAGVDPLSRAAIPVAGQTHDIVLGGVGFTLYRGNEDTLPSKVYTSEAVDYTFSPTFIDRSNTSGDWGDDQQDFFMSQVQKDWSGGEGRKFFRRATANDAYWAGENLMPTVVPGQVRRVGGIHGTTWSTGAGLGGFTNSVYVKGTGQIGGTNDPGDTLVRVSGAAATTVILEYSTDGGVTWATQQKSGATIWADCVDACMGDDGNIYFLEGSKTTTQSMVHTFKGPSLTTVAWTNWTASSLQANCICYFQGGVYVGDSAGKLCLVVSAGTKTTIKDFGGGVIMQLLATPEGIYALYLSPTGTYRVYLYSGGNTTEVLNLPRGWKINYALESGVLPDRTASGIFAMSTDAMAWSEGVLYITGLAQTRDQQQGRNGEVRYRSALYYYNAGNSGFIWEAEDSRYDHEWGSAAITVISDGMVCWADTQNDRLMVYDPRTGGVFCLSAGGLQSMSVYIGTNPTGTILNAISNNTSTTISISGMQNPLPGTILRNSTRDNDERIQIQGSGGFNMTSPYNCIRGFDFTTSLTATTSTTGDIIKTIGDSTWPFPITRLVFDFTNYTISFITQRKDFGSLSAAIRFGGSYWNYLALRENDVGALDGLIGFFTSDPPRHSWLQTSAFDFESSLAKYFRSIQVDFDTVSLPLRTDEAAGLVHAWYKLDSMMSRPFDPFFRPSDLVAINTTTAAITTGSVVTTSAVVSITLAAGHGAVVGSILYGNAGQSDESAIVTAVAGNVVTLNAGRQFMGKTAWGAEYTTRSATAWATGGTVTIQNAIASGTRYNINATGKQVQVMLAFVAGATSATVPISLGPTLRKMVVRAAPIQTGFREREYQIAMFNDQPRMSQQVTGQKNVPKETRTPSELRLALETMIRAGTPINVSDGTMTNVLCVIEPDKTKLRELRGGEFVAFVGVKEI